MKFIFLDKNLVEANIITDILGTENIPYKTKERRISVMTMPFVSTEIIKYDIECYTDLKYFDFVKQLADKKIKQLMKLEMCYTKRVRRSRKKEEVENEKTI